MLYSSNPRELELTRNTKEMYHLSLPRHIMVILKILNAILDIGYLVRMVKVWETRRTFKPLLMTPLYMNLLIQILLLLLAMRIRWSYLELNLTRVSKVLLSLP